MRNIVTFDKVETIGLVGLGAVGGALAQGALQQTPLADYPNVRDAALVVAAMWGMTLGARMRAFSAGVGSAGLVSLVNRNFPMFLGAGA